MLLANQKFFENETEVISINARLPKAVPWSRLFKGNITLPLSISSDNVPSVDKTTKAVNIHRGKNPQKYFHLGSCTYFLFLGRLSWKAICKGLLITLAFITFRHAYGDNCLKMKITRCSTS